MLSRPRTLTESGRPYETFTSHLSEASAHLDRGSCGGLCLCFSAELPEARRGARLVSQADVLALESAAARFHLRTAAVIGKRMGRVGSTTCGPVERFGHAVEIPT